MSIAGTEKVIKKLEQFAIQVTFARAGLAKISSKKTIHKQKIKQTNTLTGQALTLGITDLKTYIKGKLVTSMQESYQKETSKLKKL